MEVRHKGEEVIDVDFQGVFFVVVLLSKENDVASNDGGSVKWDTFFFFKILLYHLKIWISGE